MSVDEEDRALMTTAAKDARLNLRLRAADDALIRRAAAAAGLSVSDFLTASALERAHDVLADRRHLVLDEDAWDEFLALIDGPTEPDPRMAALLARPSRITR